MSRAPDILAALAETLDPPQVLKRFGLSPGDLKELLRQAALCLKAREEPWSLYVDGACRGNPGPAGAGAVLLDPEGRIQAQESRSLGLATNNIAEYQGLLLGLAAARARGVRRLAIFSDSQLMVEQLNGRYRVKTPHLLPLWQEARKQLQYFEVYAISHVDRALNREADRLARQAVDQGAPPGYNNT